MNLNFELHDLAQRRAARSTPRALSVDSRQGTTLDLLTLLGAPGLDTENESELAVPLRRLPSRAALFHEGAAADTLYVVRAGTFKCCRTDADGGEQVLGFARRGDVLGHAALGLGRHTSSAFALEASSVGVVSVTDLFNGLQNRPALNRALHQALSLQQARLEELSGVRAAIPAEARLARFLLHWSQRMTIGGHSLRQLRLTVNRRDIGRLLGIAPETVSRCFAALSARGCIAVHGRTLDMLDSDGLQAVARLRSGNARSAPNRPGSTLTPFERLSA